MVETEPILIVGEPESFDDFYRREYPPVVALAFSLSGSRWAAEDLAQEAFIKAHHDWERIGVIDFPGAWVRRVAANLAVSRWRRLRSEARALTRLVGAGPRAFPAIDPDHESFWNEVRALPRRQAQVVALHYLEDRPIAAIAAVLEISPDAVKSSLYKARAALTERLKDHLEGRPQ